MSIHICIMAAGQSKRMNSKLSKMLHPLCGRLVVHHVLAAVSELQPASIGMVVGFQRDRLMDALADKPVDFIVQETQLGTAHAVSEFLKHKPSISGRLLVMSGDTPLVTPALLRSILNEHAARNANTTLVTTRNESPSGYGRVLRGKEGRVERIVEEADATPSEKEIREVNAGIYVFDISLLREWLPQIQDDNKQKEFYLPDVIAVALKEKKSVFAYTAPAWEVMGINTRSELADASKMMRRRINKHWMNRGVTMIDPDTTYIDAEASISQDTTLYPGVFLEGTSQIGSDVTIYANCRITDSFIDKECVIYENSSIDSAHLEAGVKIGPFARLRPDTVVKKGARIGNFVELKKTTLGEGSKANHLAYLGDSTIGADVNIGAGTITCNYDGEKKHPTIIEDNVFIGSDVQLIAPVKVGKGAYVAAGSSITDDVPANSLAIARGRQVNKEGWASKRKPSKKTH